MAKEITITDDSVIRLKEDSHIEIDEGSKIQVQGTRDHPFFIQELQNIAPIAAHIKELNHIDPITVEELHLNEIKNIEPIRIEKFNVTNLPQVNMALRQLPPVNLNIRRLPALSVGTHQDFHMPSHYTVRARVLGIEFFRIHLDGSTRISPRERYRREQGRSHSRSFPVPETAGNPAIPSKCQGKKHHRPAFRPMHPHSHAATAGQGRSLEKTGGRPTHMTSRDFSAVAARPMDGRDGTDVSVCYGPPSRGFSIKRAATPLSYGHSAVSSGE